MRTLLLSILMFFTSVTFADIIMPNTHYVSKCIKIVNIDSFPDIQIVGNFHFYGPGTYYDTILNNACIVPDGYDFYKLNIFAVNKSLLLEKELDDFDISNNKQFVPFMEELYPVGGYMDDSLPYESITEEYRILGVSESLLYMYKHKEIITFNNEKADSITHFEYEQDSTWLLPSIPLAIKDDKANIGIEIYPNPVKENLYVNLTNTYQGDVKFRIYALTGQEVLTNNCNKIEQELSHQIHINDLPTGIYYLQTSFGETVWTEKIVVN